jgi:hypothetical protein
VIPLSKFPRLSLSEEIPSMQDLILIFNQLPDDESKEIFLGAHTWTLRMIVESWNLPGEIEKLELLKSACKHLGFDFPGYWTAQNAIIYYQHVFSREIVNPRNVYELSRTTQSLNPAVNQMSARHLSEDARLRLELPAYKRFSLLSKNFWFSVTRSMQLGDQTTIALIRQYQVLEAESLKDDLKNLADDSDPSFRVVTCQFCSKVFRVKRSQGVTIAPAHCDAIECKKAYQRLKPSKVARTALCGWVSTGSKGRCISCAAVRLVNSEKTCKKCFSEILSE